MRIVKRSRVYTNHDPLLLKLCDMRKSFPTSVCSPLDVRLMAESVLGGDLEQMAYDAECLPETIEMMNEAKDERDALSKENEWLHEALRTASLPAYLKFVQDHPTDTNRNIEAETRYDEYKRLLRVTKELRDVVEITTHERRLVALNPTGYINRIVLEIKDRGTYTDGSPLIDPKPPTRNRSK